MGFLLNILMRVIDRVCDIPRRGLPELHTNVSSFDQEFGTNTSGIVWLTNPHSKNFTHGIRYEACSPNACRWAIESACINPNDFWFVDVGCGKGRPLIIASQYSFPRLIGVEYSTRLCAEARANVERCSIRKDRCEIVCKDAAEYIFPDHDIFAYFFHPFDREVLYTVLDNLRAVAHKNRVIIAYEGSGAGTLTDCAWLRLLATGQNCLLFVDLPQHDGAPNVVEGCWRRA